MAYLLIKSTPPIVLYSPGHSRADFVDYLCYPLLRNIGAIRTTVSIDGGGENASTSAELDNGWSLELVELFSIPPLFSECEVYDRTGAHSFSGFITEVTLGESPSMRITS